MTKTETTNIQVEQAGTPTPNPSKEGNGITVLPPVKAPKALHDAGGELTKTGVEALQDALGAASRGLEHGLRAFITNGLNVGQEQVGSLENAFEAAKGAVHGRSHVGHLNAAASALETVQVILANHSLKNGLDLPLAKEFAQNAKSAVKKLTPETHP